MSFPPRLREGYRSFRSERLPMEQSRYRDLAAGGQAPETMVVGCCDSRVAPEVIFDAGPGELFVVRNVANLVPPYSPDTQLHGVSAAVEYGVTVLNVRNIVVLGHAHCGGIQAFADKAPPGDFIGRWMSLVMPAAQAIGPRDQAPETYLTRLEQASVVKSIENLMTFPYVRSACERGELVLHGAYFNVASGELEVFDRATGKFAAVAGK
ncbi:MAG: carbonic anhydrase [Xanthobacteraceae bacterium]|nr:carbonic anhydrase [Xanthobacteraceae bacterium]MBX9828197.1 carbonic anhydrase [Xanthobacteraceae bacterium]